MLTLHGIWIDGMLHVWGEQGTASSPSMGATVSAEAAPACYPYAVEPAVLRGHLGDLFDGLLVSGASRSVLTLHMPQRGGVPIPSWAASEPVSSTGDGRPVTLGRYRVSTLAFAAADAIDLLAGLGPAVRDSVELGSSFRYWSRVGVLVLDLMARQRFVPAIHHVSGDTYRGYWRVVVDDDATSQRLAALIESMPPVCRAVVDGEEQASGAVENFLWTAVDALVRRCLEGDDLAHAIQDRPADECSGQMHWLRSVVGGDATVGGEPDDRRTIYRMVHGWISRLEPAPGGRSCRTCFQLQAPATADAKWSLTLHVQSTRDPDVVLDAEQLLNGDGSEDPRILRRPFDNALELLRLDVKFAARHFPPLMPLAAAESPAQCDLSLEEAYTFLRDAAPILETEGFGVWVPSWWRESRPRMRMWLDLHPGESQPTSAGAVLGLDAVVGYDWRIAVGDEDLSADELGQLATAKSPLVKVHGQWTEVHPSEVQAAIKFMTGNRAGRMTVFEALRQCYVADDLETGLPVAGMRAHGWVENLLGATEMHEAVEHLAPPAGFHGELRPYQLRGLEWLSFLARLGLGACLADDMGLGKTIQLIALLLHERAGGKKPGPTLLVVPMSLVGNWQREIERFGPSLRSMIHHGTERLLGQDFVDTVAAHDVVISTYGLIHRDLEHLVDVDWHRLALDEAQNIKNPAAKQAVAIRALRAVHRVALTGTPVENRLSELWSIMDFLNAGYLGGATEFRRRFAVPIERYHDADRAQRLRHLIRPFILRRVKSDPRIEVDLPDKMEMKVYCNLTREQAGLYQALVDNMLGQIDRAGGIQRRGLILATLVKLKQVCNHPVQFLGDGGTLPHRSGKCDRITEMVEEVLAEGDRALIFTQFREMGELLLKLLREAFDREVLLLHGGTTRKNRDAIVDRFQDEADDAPLLILSLKAGGYGLNLTAASHVFHFDRWWNPAVEDQATDRAHRIGQDKRVQVHKFVCIGTLEERIDALLEQKRDLAANVVGRGEEWLTELSTDKLREVFALSREAVADE